MVERIYGREICRFKHVQDLTGDIMIRINQLTLPADHGPEDIKKKAAKLLRISEDEIADVRIIRRSVDARKKENILFSYIVDVALTQESREDPLVRKIKDINIKKEDEKRYIYPEHGRDRMAKRPVIIGAGPAGLFAALALAENGMRPIVFEQGDPVDERVKTVDRFWEAGAAALDPRSNVSFGEGGAGTFSDGKLNTLVKDTYGRSRFVLETFVKAGADTDILIDSKPHIGTDMLRTVIKNIRQRIIDHGGEFYFRTCVNDIDIAKDPGTGRAFIDRIIFAGGKSMDVENVIIAPGHSSRDFFYTLYSRGVKIESKPFAVGLRIEHPQSMINFSQYKREDAGILGEASYKLTAQTSGGRGVYSFCMCPGGYVVNASSEKGMTAVNGMSDRARDSGTANSAVVVTVTPNDYPGDSPLAGIKFQRELEKKAFRLGRSSIPVQLYGDYRAGRESSSFGDVNPAFCGGTSFADLNELFPEDINAAFREGIDRFSKKIAGFDRYDAILAGVESRTSSPVRILRDENFESNIKGLYPCGEGAGYAGGIMSAAMDGLKTAESLISRFEPL